MPPTGPQIGSGSSSKPVRRAKRKRFSARRLFAFDRELGARFVAGADEAGRGCLAGPLVAAAVLLDYESLTARQQQDLRALNDSKQHTAQAREELYPLVLQTAVRVSVVSRCVRGIDSRGLHNTNLAALRDALLAVTSDAPQDLVCLSDGFPLAGLSRPARAVVSGDATSAAIAAASIVAKVSRDRYMQHADSLHPGWSFAEHVGYSTPAHREAIVRIGVSPLHRLSFQSLAYQQLRLLEV